MNSVLPSTPRIGYIFNQCKKMGLWEAFEKDGSTLSITINGRRIYFKNDKQYKFFKILYNMLKKSGFDENELLDSMPNVIKLKEDINMNKNLIRLTESDLHKIVRRSVGKILREFGSDGPDFADYEVPGYEGTNVPDGLYYNELDANEDFDDFLNDSQYIREPNIGERINSASDFDTDDSLLDFSSGGKHRFGESKKRMGRIIRESIRKVLIENDDEWRDAYRDDKGNRIQSNGHGPNKRFRTIKSDNK